VAAYTGGDPASWSLIGRYDIGSIPRGKNAFINVAGDVLILTAEGVIPISQVVSKDPVALDLVSIAKNIAPDWRREALLRGDEWPWQAVKYGPGEMALATWPKHESSPGCPVVNLKTGAWSKFTAWDALSFVVHKKRLYFGTTMGRVFLADDGAEDDGELYTATCVQAFNDLGSPGVSKVVNLCRSVYVSQYPFTPQITACVDYRVDLPAAPSALGFTAPTIGWDFSVWDVGVWDAAAEAAPPGVVARWDTINREGFAHAFALQITFSGTVKPDLEYLRSTLTYTVGTVVVSGV
jgi:hypothetical protein